MRALCSKLCGLVAIACILILPGLAQAGITGFGDFSAFTFNKGSLDTGPSPNIVPGQIEITDNAGNETRSLFYNAPQPITAFTASFTYREVGGSSAAPQGVTFCLQNTTPGVHAVANSLGGFGFNGLAIFDFPNRSAAVSLELSNPTGTALYTGGAVTLGGANPSGPVNLLSGHPINVTLKYSGSLLHETLFDTVTHAQADFSYFVNLPQLLGGNTAYVGFTAQTPANGFGFVADQQYLSNFTFSVPEPSSFALLATGLALPLVRLVRRRRA